jgi:hypothetical protein
MLVVDPSLVNIDDLYDPKPGKLIRLRRAAWGRGVDGAVKQLQVNDVTRGNIQDMGILGDIMKQVMASTDNLQGVPWKRSERISAEEAGNVQAGGIARLEWLVRIIGLQGHYPLGKMLASHTQQLMSKDTWVKMMGSYVQELQAEYGDAQEIPVGPEDINGAFDAVPYDSGIYQSGNSASWSNIFQIISQNPWIVQAGKLSVSRIFFHLARTLGVRNMTDFIEKGGQVQPTVLPDDQVAKLVESGQLVASQSAPTMGI